MLDDLGRRMKRDYEDALRLYLPRRAYVVVRVDGRAFHAFTRGMERPYCRPLADALDCAAAVLCSEMIGCQFAFGQSDEYSFLLNDGVWFDGNMQKIASVAASVFTAAFARAFPSDRDATFDARVLLIPQRSEVAQYFVWRQLDASSNSLNMLASAHYSHKELLGKSTAEKHDLLHAKGLNWAKEPADFKRGRVVRPANGGWIVEREVPVFQREPGYLDALIPSAD
jgi:tRNA(His) guanylyltransferase